MMNSKFNGTPYLQGAIAAVVAAALGALCAPAMAAGAPGHATASFSVLSEKGAGAVGGGVADSQWVFPAEQVFNAEPAQVLADAPGGHANAFLSENSSESSFSQTVEAHHRHDSGGWGDHGGFEGSHFDDGHFDDRHLCDDCCVTPPSAVPEPGQLALMLAGLVFVVFRVKHQRQRRPLK